MRRHHGFAALAAATALSALAAPSLADGDWEPPKSGLRDEYA